MFKLLFVVAFLSYCSAVSVVDNDARFSLSKTVSLDFRELREKQKSSGKVASFPHVRQLKAAIATNQKRVTLQTTSENKEVPSSFKSVDEMISYSSSETTTILDLLDDVTFHSLDFDQDTIVSKINDEGSVHCGSTKIRRGDIIFATGELFSKNTRLLKQSEPLSSFLRETHQDHDQFVLLRRVLSVSLDQETSCFSYQTENIHPVEVLKGFDIQTKTHIPVHLTNAGIKKSNLRKLKTDGTMNSAWINPALNDCKTASAYAKPDVKVDDMYMDYRYYVGVTSGTAYFCGDFGGPTSGSIGANYDFVSKSAVTSEINLGNGYVCKDCYAFLGSTILTHVEWNLVLLPLSQTIGIQFEVSGGSGFNVDLEMTDPQALSTTSVIAPAVNDYATIMTIDATTASTLQYRFGGLNAVLKTVVSGKGTASASAKEEFTASISSMLVNSVLSFPISYTATSNVPAVSTTNMQFNEASILLTLEAIFVFRLSVLDGLLTLDADINVAPYTQYSYKGVGNISDCADTNSPAQLTYGMDTSGSFETFAIRLPGLDVTYATNLSSFKSDPVSLTKSQTCVAGSGTYVSPSSSSSDGSTPNLALTVGLSVGIFAAVAILIFVLWYFNYLTNYCSNADKLDEKKTENVNNPLLS